jgi:hypothetical protein
MYFGDGNTNHYCLIGSFFNASGTAILPAEDNPVYPAGYVEFDATGKTLLTFSVLADVRQSPDVDAITVRLNSTVNDDQIVVWSKGDLAEDDFGNWTNVTIDLTPHAPFQGRVNVLFDTVDSQSDGGCYDGGTGVYVDDLKIEQNCAP